MSETELELTKVRGDMILAFVQATHTGFDTKPNKEKHKLFHEIWFKVKEWHRHYNGWVDMEDKPAEMDVVEYWLSHFDF